MTQPGTTDPKRPHSADEFADVINKMEGYLDTLLSCEDCGRESGRVPPLTHGVYLFTEAPKSASGMAPGELPRHMYVGRAGLTERARAKGHGHSNFRTRLAGHTRPSSAHNQATFAFRLAVEKLGSAIGDLPNERAARAKHPDFEPTFKAMKERVAAMEFRVVEIPDDADFEAYLLEPYAAFRLGTPYNSWATS